MLNFQNTIMANIVSKYVESVRNALAEPDFATTNESNIHTEYIHRCSRGDINAREYVIRKISDYLNDKVSDNDIKKIEVVINDEINIYKNKSYEIYDYENIDPNKECLISYYQLLELSASDEQKKRLDNIYEKNFTPIDVLALEIYKVEYGIDIIDELLIMKINNIEVHDIYKIRVELASGHWATLSDFTFTEGDRIKQVSVRLLNQQSGGDLTEEQCERESMLLDGSRIMVALKPASSMNNIFIKKFDSFNVTGEEMINNGTVTDEMLEDFKVLAKGRASVIVYGGVNTGKTTFSKMYVGLYPKQYKIGVVDAAKDMDLRPLYPDRDIITLYETDTYSLNDQFSRLLRANRHILCISEARSYEVEQMIKAMTRGNSGSFCTIHSTSAKDVVDNIAYMCLENGVAQDMRILRSRITSAVDIIIRIRHFEDTGLRRVDEISELVLTENLDRPFKIQNIYKWDYKEAKAIRNKEYKLSEDLEDKLRYFGCTEEEIARFKE